MSKELINISASAFDMVGLKVYNALRSEPIKDVENERIWNIIVKYYYSLGISRDNFPNDIEKVIIIDHLKKNHERLRIDELDLVLNNYTAGNYPDLNHFGKISAAFLSAIIHRYQQQEKIAYTKQIMALRNNKAEAKKEVEKLEGKEAFERLCKTYIKGQYTQGFPYWVTVFDYLEDIGEIVISKEEKLKVKEEITKYYSDRWFYQMDANAKRIVDDEKMIRFECKRKCVIEYMEKREVI